MYFSSFKMLYTAVQRCSPCEVLFAEQKLMEQVPQRCEYADRIATADSLTKAQCMLNNFMDACHMAASMVCLTLLDLSLRSQLM